MRTRALILATAALLALPGCAPSRAVGMSFVTFMVDTFRSVNEDDLNLPVHVTIYLDNISGTDLFTVDGNTGNQNIFPFDVPGDLTVPGSYPTSPVTQKVYFDMKNQDFVLRAKATFTGDFGMAVRCRVYDSAGRLTGTEATEYIDHPRDTKTVECKY
jgi:hypothetical protein